MRLNKYNEKLNTINMIVIACFILDIFYIVRGWLDCFRLRKFCGGNIFVKEGRGELSFLKIYNLTPKMADKISACKCAAL